MAALSLRLPDELEIRLDREAGLAGLPRSDVVRDAIEQYLERRERDRLMAVFAAEARTIYGDPELRAAALAMAEGALASASEALDIAEGRSATKSGRSNRNHSTQRESRK